VSDDKQLPTQSGGHALFNPDSSFSASELALREVPEALDNRLVIAFVGAASAGKDSAIRAIFGVDFGEVDPIPGTTDRVRAVRLDREGQVILVNAPGFGDLRRDVDEAIWELVQRIDVAVYVMNADGGATEDEKRHYDAVRQLGRPVLLCINKIDLIRPHQQEEFVAATLAQMHVDSADAVTTAFDPLPVLSEEPLGVVEVADWIFRTVQEGGKGLMFAKQMRNKALACEPLIRSAARRAAVAGAIPLPGADITATSAIQVKLINDISTVYGRRIDRDISLFIVGETLAGAGKGFIRYATTALKAAGWIPGGHLGELAASAMGASLASASTYGVGRAAIQYMENIEKGVELTGSELRDVFDKFAEGWHQRNNQGAIEGPAETQGAIETGKAALQGVLDAQIIED
jgi:uncharacterized protein (DUF697 family)/GTP-binding protein EngB required for normal cell division